MKDEKMKVLHDMITSYCILNEISDEFIINYCISTILALFERNHIPFQIFDEFLNETKIAYEKMKVNH
jgi:hypothetical protein